MSATVPSRKWYWEKTDPSRSGSSGDLSKLFRNENVKQPGVFSAGAPSADATVLAREVIQNSWDAAIELREDSDDPPPFEIRFSFGAALAERKGQLIVRLGLDELAERLDGSDVGELGLHSPNCLEQLSQGGVLPYLLIEESGTTGMYGPWSGDRSKMYLALATVSFHAKRAGTGGSYGYGKSGLIRGSAVRTVVAYTCFRERDDDPSVTRRLLGMVYWGQHHRGDESYTGFGRFGHEQDPQDPDAIVPFENEKADEIADGLGIPVRDPEFPEQLGTTFLLIDPTVRAPDLVKAIERSWWPALESGVDFNAVVETVEGHESCPRPRKDDVLATFLDAYESATAPPDNRRSDRKQVVLRPIGSFPRPGVLGLVADPAEWSYPEQTEPSGNEVIEHRSLVALVRKPRMVVEYYDSGRTAPYVRGVFVADESVDEALRATEPKGHDAWQTTASESDDIAPSATQCAKQIVTRIRSAVADFRRQLKPAPQRADDYVLPAFDRAMRKLLAGSEPGPNPPPAPRPVAIHPDWKLTPVAADSLKVSGSVAFFLTDHVPDDEADVAVSIRYVFVEDDRTGDDAEITVDAPAGFGPAGGSNGFVGRLARGVEARFRFETAPYRNDWTGELRANAELVKDANVEQ